ncbi:asparaginase domain-containing protein [Burkholderia sp. FERM BP-3421]|jgi:L-asparaginase|uniref:asparaginase domain-containing protein n=1 Tax=Burkholderia sp. FERM BP-3421 TaxID=1494466 RepID=UPI00235F692A|nr:asparaginase domain-containing protein [Burkholderia sp. FERM BP-3421]WDD93600.1 asparaginase domain-containing protein [Burkholderia sp. FERM BP-3421]
MSHVYVLYTGGTIGCIGTPLAPMPGPQFQALIESMPGLAGGEVAGYPDLSYTVAWFDTPLDSSNMTPADWITIAQSLAEVYDDYDGFVVLHGTDTMAFSAAATSFLLQGLAKPVVFTGSQVPLATTLNDALTNLIGAIVIAGTTGIPESLLYFDSLLLRGNRSVKVNANQFAAFASPNFPPLATVAAQITINTALLLPPPDWSVSLDNPANLAAAKTRLSSQSQALRNFAAIVMTLYPGIGASVANAMINESAPAVRGVVIEAFGEGNGPSAADFLQVLSTANKAGVVLMDNTQVLAGTVNIGAYETGSGLAEAGAISAYDMVPEASLAKLVSLISVGMAPAEIRKTMQRSLAGEITPPESAAVRTLPGH